jgi:hypothetical protein
MVKTYLEDGGISYHTTSGDIHLYSEEYGKHISDANYKSGCKLYNTVERIIIYILITIIIITFQW